MNQLPIEVIPLSRPVRFRWRYKLDGSTVECEGSLSATLEEALTELIRSTEQLAMERDNLGKLNTSLKRRNDELVEQVAEPAKLQAFKDWVHTYLDAHGVPKEFPDGPHTREGCRIGDRLDWLVKAITHSFAEDALKAALAACEKELAEAREERDAANRRANSVETLNSNQRQMLDQARMQLADGKR